MRLEYQKTHNNNLEDILLNNLPPDILATNILEKLLIIFATIKLNNTENELNIRKISDNLRKILPGIAVKLIWGNSNFDEQTRKLITENLLNNRLHNLSWHLYDILTHTIVTQRSLLRLSEEYSTCDTYNVLGQKVGGFTKLELLTSMAGQLHDLGKWGGAQHRTGADEKPIYQILKVKDKVINVPVLTFQDHEKLSGKIITDKDSFVYKILDYLFKKHGVKNQKDRIDIIEYLGKVSEYHFELGIVRKKAKSHPEMKYSDWIDTNTCEQVLLEIFNDPNKKPYILEIILFFLADTDAKLDQKSLIGVMDNLPENYTTSDILNNIIKPLPNMPYQIDTGGKLNMSLIEYITTKYPELEQIKIEMLMLKGNQQAIDELANDFDKKESESKLAKMIKKAPYLCGIIQYPDNLKLFKKALETYYQWMKNQSEEKLNL